MFAKRTMNPYCPSHHSVGVGVIVWSISSSSAEPLFTGWSIRDGFTPPYHFPTRIHETSHSANDSNRQGDGREPIDPLRKRRGQRPEVLPWTHRRPHNNAIPSPKRYSKPETFDEGWPAAKRNVACTVTGAPFHAAGRNRQFWTRNANSAARVSSDAVETRTFIGAPFSFTSNETTAVAYPPRSIASGNSA